MNSTPKISFNLFFILLLVCIHWSCQTHYAYRPKVRVKQPKQLVLKKEKLDVNNRMDSLIDQAPADMFASVDTTINLQYYYSEKSSIRVDSEFVQNQINNLKPKKSHPKSVQKLPKSGTFNYHAKWSLIVGFLSALLFPIFIGPTAIIFGLKALSEIKKKFQKGKALAISGILLGAFTTISILFLLVIGLISIPSLEAYVFFYVTFLVLIFIQNLIVHYVIEKSPKNPSFKEYKVNPQTVVKTGTSIFLLVLISILLLLNAAFILSSFGY